MTRLARQEYAAALREPYRTAGKAEKGRLLDEFCRTTGVIGRRRSGCFAPRPRGGQQGAAGGPGAMTRS